MASRQVNMFVRLRTKFEFFLVRSKFALSTKFGSPDAFLMKLSWAGYLHSRMLPKGHPSIRGIDPRAAVFQSCSHPDLGERKTSRAFFRRGLAI